MKPIIQLSFTILLGLVLFSCAVQHHTESSLNTYQTAMNKYEKKDYYNARKLFSRSNTVTQREKGNNIGSILSSTFLFLRQKYKESAYYFTEFYKTYPRVPQAEEALYMQGCSMYLISPNTRLDATQTEKALKVLRQYKNQYPTGIYQLQVQHYIQELQSRLALKAFSITKLYYNLGHYGAAVTTINKFQEAYPNTSYCEEAAYIKTKAQCKLARAATTETELDSWRIVIQYYYELLDQYPDSKYVKEVQTIYEQALKKVEQLSNY